MKRRFKTNIKTGKQQLPLPLRKAIAGLLRDKRISPELIKSVYPSISLQYLQNNKKEVPDYTFHNDYLLFLYEQMINEFSQNEIFACVRFTPYAKFTIFDERNNDQKTV